MWELNRATKAFRYLGGSHIVDCRCRFCGEYNTLRTLPSEYGIMLGFFSRPQNYKRHPRESESKEVVDFYKIQLSWTTKQCLYHWNLEIPIKMSGSTRVPIRVGCGRNNTYEVSVHSLEDVSINYITQPRRQGTLVASTPWTADADFVANIKSWELCHLDMVSC
jgi:hypothetical protein